MQAMLLDRPAPVADGPLVLRDLPVPEPGPGQVRLRVRACGVCHTDLHIVEGDLPLVKSPLILGHQIVAIVDALGPGVAEPRLGDRVGLPWVHETCGTCSQCTAGRENLCERARFTGYHVNGGFAEFTLAPASFVHPLPPAMRDLEAAPLLCAGIIGFRALRLSGIHPGERLGLWGFGAAAHLAIQVARAWGCEVFVVTRSPEHRDHARALGAAWVGGPGEAPPRLLDAAVNFTPAGGSVPEGLRALRPGGTLALGGIHMSPLPTMDYAAIYGERILRSVANSTRQDARDFLALAAEIPVRTDIEVFPLDQANEALRRLKASQVHGAAVLDLTG